MSLPRTLLGLCLLATPLPALAQGLSGSWELDGRYSNQRRSQADVTIERLPDGRLRVVREGRIASGHLAGTRFTWTSGPGQTSSGSSTLRVVYRLSGSFVSGLGSGLPNTLLATYRLQSDGTLAETLVNLTRRAPEDFWSVVRTRGGRSDPALLPFKRAARAAAEDLTAFIMDWRADVADYYEPGDEDTYERDERAARTLFHAARWEPVAVPAPLVAARALRAVIEDPEQVVGDGQILVLLDAQARVQELAYLTDGEIYHGSAGSIDWVSPPSPPQPPVVVDCPLGGAPVGDLIAKARAAREESAQFVMRFRSDIADYYDPGEQALYDADEQAARAFFQGADYVEAAIPPGYAAYKAIEARNQDPQDVIGGKVFLLFDCAGNLIKTVLLHEGEYYDSEMI